MVFGSSRRCLALRGKVVAFSFEFANEKQVCDRECRLFAVTTSGRASDSVVGTTTGGKLVIGDSSATSAGPLCGASDSAGGTLNPEFESEIRTSNSYRKNQPTAAYSSHII